MTPTPRTDDEENEGLIRGYATPTKVVRAGFARQLERENAELLEALKLKLGILLESQNAEIHRLKAELEEMTARATSLVLHLPPETLAGDVQRWRDETKALLANAKVEQPAPRETP